MTSEVNVDCILHRKSNSTWKKHFYMPLEVLSIPLSEPPTPFYARIVTPNPGLFNLTSCLRLLRL